MSYWLCLDKKQVNTRASAVSLKAYAVACCCCKSLRHFNSIMANGEETDASVAQSLACVLAGCDLAVDVGDHEKVVVVDLPLDPVSADYDLSWHSIMKNKAVCSK